MKSPSFLTCTLALLPPLFALLRNRHVLFILLSDLRFPRILHFLALGGLGAALQLRLQPEAALKNWPDLALSFLLLLASLCYAAIFAIVSNNHFDLEADKISNPDRPLVKGSIAPKTYWQIGIFCQIWALLLAALHSWILFAGILAISLGYALYSCPPFRLKRLPLVAKTIIGLNSWALALTGFALVGGDWQEFPTIWTIFILGPLALAANFIDLKDVEGDGATGIKTLPVLMGLEKARLLMAFAALACYLMAGWLLAIPWLWAMLLPTAAAHIFLLYRRPFQEAWVFILYVGALFGLDFFLFFSQSSF